MRESSVEVNDKKKNMNMTERKMGIRKTEREESSGEKKVGSGRKDR